MLGGRDHDVEDEEPIGRKAHEEAHDYRQQHVHHLPPGPVMIRVAGAGGRRRRVADQVIHDNRVQYHEYHKRRDEEEQHQQQEERHAGDRVGLRQAHRYAIHLIRHMLISPDVSNDFVRDVTRHPHFAILRHPDHRAAINREKKKEKRKRTSFHLAFISAVKLRLQ